MTRAREKSVRNLVRQDNKGSELWCSLQMMHAIPLNFLVTPILAVAVAYLLWSQELATHAADSAWWSLFLHSLMLLFGLTCLLEFIISARYWQKYAHELNRAADIVRETHIRGAEWPSPALLGELPQRPFSLHVRPQDLNSLHTYSSESWISDTKNILQKSSSSAIEQEAFKKWELRLIAEMRYASQAVRTLSWCAIASPILVLISTSVYPAFNERIVATLSISLIIACFGLVMYTAVQLENHPLLRKMFTLHGNKEKLGAFEIFGVVWAKLFGAILVLVPILIPEIIGWVRGIIRSLSAI